MREIKNANGCLRELKPLKEGQRFGRLVVIGLDEEKSIKIGKPYYFCKCDCGSPIKSILKQSLTTNCHPTRSCGCIVKEKAGYVYDRFLAIKKLLYKKTKNRHINDLNCSEDGFIDFELFQQEIEKPCFYCGIEKSSYKKDRSTGEVFYYHGLDRIDSSKGYEVNNVVPCCKRCNIAKGELTQEEFREFIRRLHSFSEKRNGR